MKEYDFEYTIQGIAYLLLLSSFIILALTTYILHILFPNILLVDIFISIAIGVAFFLFNKHRIKRNGIAKLSDTGIILELSETEDFAFNDLKYYYIYNGKNGIVFTLGFLDGTKLKMGANNNFCNVQPFSALLTDLQSTIENYKVQNAKDIVHLESILARKNSIYMLSFITILVILSFIFTKMPVMIISIAFTMPILFNWIQYLKLKQNNKLVDF
ncbi:MAG: hypothetical protein JWR50_2346 [Mucilaginibacter sp.]|nr:hypothetical protein [Mucilaginibacter sp.]